MKADFSVSYLILAIAFTAASSRAGEIPIDISALVNVLWTSPFCDNSIVNGSTFPSGSQNYGGVPFDIPTSPNNYWSGSVAGNCGSGTVSLTFPLVCRASPRSSLCSTHSGARRAQIPICMSLSPGAAARLLRGRWWAA